MKLHRSKRRINHQRLDPRWNGLHLISNRRQHCCSSQGALLGAIFNEMIWLPRFAQVRYTHIPVLYAVMKQGPSRHGGFISVLSFVSHWFSPVCCWLSCSARSFMGWVPESTENNTSTKHINVWLKFRAGNFYFLSWISHSLPSMKSRTYRGNPKPWKLCRSTSVMKHFLLIQ